MSWMKVFFQFFGRIKGIEHMFDEEEPPKKTKPIDLDDLSIEEIEEMISNYRSEIKNLEILLKKKKDKIKLADDFFKKN